MVTLTIDNRPVTVPEGTTILDAAKTVDIHIPTLCYLREINEVAACRVCAVEVEGVDKLAAACNTQVEGGMVVRTNTQRVRLARKTNVELILSQHVDHCVTCVRSGNCSLQALSKAMNIQEVPFRNEATERPWDKTLPILRDSSKCIKCLRCVSVCERVQSLGVWEVTGSGAHTTVRIKGGLRMNEANCALCGQCVSHCPVGALRERDDTELVFEALCDPTKEVVFQVAPAVRAAWGESLGLSQDKATEKRLAAAIRAMGVKHVFDTTFSADLTILEESSEFIERFTHSETSKLPMFTSCCPGWVRFLRTEYPELAGNLSTAKSPQQMFGAIAKSYYAKLLEKEPKDIFCVSVMPCVAKKYEAGTPEASDVTDHDVDVVLTTRELDRMLQAMQINVAALPEEDFDSPLGRGSGAGVIFGVTGGVTEAVIRHVLGTVTTEQIASVAECGVRGLEGIKAFEVKAGDLTLKIAVASGLGNADKLIEKIESGEEFFHFVEIMACPGGCIGGGGQPEACFEQKKLRNEGMFIADEDCTLRSSEQNTALDGVYNLLRGRAHDLLHVHYPDHGHE